MYIFRRIASSSFIDKINLLKITISLNGNHFNCWNICLLGASGGASSINIDAFFRILLILVWFSFEQIPQNKLQYSMSGLT